MKKGLFIVFLLLVSFPPLSVSAREYTLDELFTLALHRNETIKIAEEDLYISKREKDRALATLLPTLSAFGTHTRYSEEKQKVSFTIQPEISNTWGFRIDQSFSLSGKELTGYKITREEIVKSNFDLKAIKEGYLLTVASSYYEVLKSKKALDIANANVERLTKHRDAARTRLKVGEVTKTVLLRAEAELAGAESDLIRAENTMRFSKTILARRVGIREDFDVKENQQLTNTEVSERELVNLVFLACNCQISNIDCLKEKALSGRAEIKALTVQKKIAEKKVKYAKGSYWPSLSVEGVYSRKEDNPSSSFEINERIYGGLTFDFPFFEGGLRRAEVREARAKLRQAEYSLSDLKHSIAVEVENSYLNLLTESAILTRLQAEVKYASDNYNAVSKQFQHGLANSIDVMDANTLLVTSNRELSNARFSYALRSLELRRATGTLLEMVMSQKPASASERTK